MERPDAVLMQPICTCSCQSAQVPLLYPQRHETVTGVTESHDTLDWIITGSGQLELLLAKFISDYTELTLAK